MQDDNYHRPPILDMSRLEPVYDKNWNPKSTEIFIRTVKKSDGRVGNGNKIAARSGSKVTENDVREIRKVFDVTPKGEYSAAAKNLARKYGIQPDAVRRIGLRKTWKNVE